MNGAFPQPDAHLRLVKFSIVGAIGIGVQLAVLAGLTAMRMNYLLATALAVESAMLHNFLWHRGFTWAERHEAARHGTLRSLIRFQISNGGISLVGNLFLMRWMVGSRHWPVMGANAITITLCWAANYLASDRWVFPESKRSRTKPTPFNISSRSLAPIVHASEPGYVARRERK
jgi:putative flippase GtrA